MLLFLHAVHLLIFVEGKIQKHVFQMKILMQNSKVYVNCTYRNGNELT